MKIKMRHIMNKVGFHLLPFTIIICLLDKKHYNAIQILSELKQQWHILRIPTLVQQHDCRINARCCASTTHMQSIVPVTLKLPDVTEGCNLSHKCCLWLKGPSWGAHNTRLVSCGAKSWLEKQQTFKSCLHLWWFGSSCRVHLWCRKEWARG